MQITINGKKETFNSTETLLELIQRKSLNKDKIVVELNLKIIPQENLERALIKAGDSIEIVSFVTGG